MRPSLHALLSSILSLATLSSAHALEPKAIVPAMQAVQAGKVVVAWAPDYRSVLGLDGDGARVWRLATGDQGGGRDLERVGDNVVVYAGQEAILVAPDSGKVLGRRAGVTRGAKDGCAVREQDGACALSCGCSFEVVACGTLATLGKPIVTTPEPGTSACHAFEPEIVGRAGDTIVMTVPSQASRTSRVVPIARGYDAKTGAVRWESALLSRLRGEQSGVGPEMCSAVTDSGKLMGFDCANGALVWELGLDTKSMPQVDRTAAGVLVADGPYVSLLDARTGAPRWRVARAGLALMASVVPRERTGNWDVARVYGDDGAILGDVKLPAGIAQAPRRFGDGWVALGKSNIAAFDGRGKSLGGIGTSAVWFGVAVGTRKLLGWDGNAVTIVHAPSKRASIVINEPSEVVAFEGPIGDGHLVTLLRPREAWDATNPETFGELRFYAVAP